MRKGLSDSAQQVTDGSLTSDGHVTVINHSCMSGKKENFMSFYKKAKVEKTKQNTATNIR